jgi:competence CoiA-like predicted nuclease
VELYRLFMLYGCKDNGERRQPGYSGEKATCPMCGAQLIGKCGQIRIWHWQHRKHSECDSWQEGETDWHREWKLRFPEPWREVVVIKGDQKHRADIRTAGGTVVEFQNSPISMEDVGRREQFYGDLIWVVNASHFSQNLELLSLSTIKKYQLQEAHAQEYKEFERQLENAEWEIRNKFLQANGLSEKILFERELAVLRGSLLKMFEMDKRAFIIQLMEDDRFQASNSIHRVLGGIKYHYKGQYDYIMQKERSLLTRRDQLRGFISEIEAYDKMWHKGRIYSIVPATRISSRSFGDFIAVPLSDHSKTIHFKNEREFVLAKKSFFEYKFLTDATDKLEVRKSQLARIEDELQKSFALYGAMEKAIYNELIPNTSGSGLSQYHDNELKKLHTERAVLATELQEFRIHRDNQLAKKSQEMLIKTQQEKHVIDEENKDQFRLNWRYARKVWLEVEAKVYFDTCEGYLLELLNHNHVRKIGLDCFMKKFLDT